MSLVSVAHKMNKIRQNSVDTVLDEDSIRIKPNTEK